MKVGLIDADSHNFPNLCLMKLAAHHKARGDTVDWWSPIEEYDLVYKSRVFDDTYTTEDTITPIKADQVICGGTDYDLQNKLPAVVEHQYPDYSIYPRFREAYGFLTRGCPRGCSFCIVGEKEGRRSVQVAEPGEFWRGQEKLKLLDPNILACADHERLLLQLADCGAEVDFTQGLDARLLTPDNIELLRRIKYDRLHFAWDREAGSDLVLSRLQMFQDAGGSKDRHKAAVYILTNYDTTFAFDLHRVYTLQRLGLDPYVMIYNKPGAPEHIRRLQQWVNNRKAWRSCGRFEDFEPNLGRRLQKEKQTDGQLRLGV